MNQNNLTLSTTRLPLDHIVSGTIAGIIGAGGIGYYEYKNGNTTKQEAISKTIKLSVQGGIASGCAIMASNYIAKNNFLGAISAIGLGLGCIMAVEKISNNIKTGDTK